MKRRLARFLILEENYFERTANIGRPLVNWLKDGANKDPKDIAKPTNIELFPPSALLEGEGATQQLTVLAHYSDGTTRDVTPTYCISIK